MYQFFIEDGQVGKEYVTITGSDVNHIKNVLRMRPGEKIRVSSRSGQDFFCEIAELTDEFVQADILNEEAPSTELPSRIYLFQALPKGDRMESVIQKAVELGVYEIIPVSMRYCVVKLDEKKAARKVERWQAISETAAKQSKRSLIPRIHPVMGYPEALAYAASCDVNLVPYENERGMQATREALAKLQPGKIHQHSDRSGGRFCGTGDRSGPPEDGCDFPGETDFAHRYGGLLRHVHGDAVSGKPGGGQRQNS